MSVPSRDHIGQLYAAYGLCTSPTRQRLPLSLSVFVILVSLQVSVSLSLLLSPPLSLSLFASLLFVSRSAPLCLSCKFLRLPGSSLFLSSPFLSPLSSSHLSSPSGCSNLSRVNVDACKLMTRQALADVKKQYPHIDISCKF